MAGSLSPRPSSQAELESQACSNRAAFDLWLEAQGLPSGSCAGEERDSQLLLFSGRADLAPALLAALLFEADLRPDDRLWLAGPAPPWLAAALSFSGGLTARPEEASLLVAPEMPAELPPAVRRVLLNGPGDVIVVLWREAQSQGRESSAD